MDDRRTYLRQRVLKTGSIRFNRAAGISCTVRNMSEGGACLEVASPFGIPDNFTLIIESEDVLRPCRVAWSNSSRIGVAFV